MGVRHHCTCHKVLGCSHTGNGVNVLRNFSEPTDRVQFLRLLLFMSPSIHAGELPIAYVLRKQVAFVWRLPISWPSQVKLFDFGFVPAVFRGNGGDTGRARDTAFCHPCLSFSLSPTGRNQGPMNPTLLIPGWFCEEQCQLHTSTGSDAGLRCICVKLRVAVQARSQG